MTLFAIVAIDETGRTAIAPPCSPANSEDAVFPENVFPTIWSASTASAPIRSHMAPPSPPVESWRMYA